LSYPLTLSESAKDYLSKITIDHDRPYVHLAVDSGGCSGFQYSWDFADNEEKGILVDDILVVDSLAEMFVIGCTVEYVNELGGSYLKVVNPNAKVQCGCGESFGV
tara:strand:+ start:2546 stop:2860 length:315 start_codon:yes stop_codon:yes gene_type:complete